jgi:hypothetical protein
VTNATLKLYATAAGTKGYSVRSVSSAWSESAITYNNSPAPGSTLRTIGAFAANTWTSADITNAVKSNGTLRIAITSTGGDAVYASRESPTAAQRPQLVITENRPGPTPTTTSPAPVPTTTSPRPTVSTSVSTSTSTSTSTTSAPPSGDPVIAVVGDVACDPTDANYNNGLGTGSYCHQASTAALLDNSLAAVLAIGDLAYEDGTLAKFNSSFDPTWGPFKSLMRPIPGNHEYLERVPNTTTPTNAGGYYDYFGALAGDRTKGYYSYDIGSWHLIALNGECSYVGGCGVNSPQETWLRQDLVAHPNACTLAYWHEPKFSSGTAAVGNTSTYQTFWDDLYAAKAEVILGGHIHNYERFAKQNPQGGADPVNGVREFVVGTGGKSLVAFASTPLPNSEVRDAATYGVLKMTLHNGSYSWNFAPEAGKTFTDSGTESCH